MIIDELITKLTYKEDKAGARRHETNMRAMVRTADRHVRSMERSFSGSSSRISKMLQFSVKMHGIGAATGQLSMLNKAAGNVASGMKNIAMTAGAAGLAMAGVLAKKTFDATGEKQMQMARLETVLGNKSLAVEKYKMMAKFGAETPYQKNDLLSGFSSVAGSGYQMTNADLTALGDLSAGSGKDSFAPMIEMLKSANRGQGAMVDNFDGMKASSDGGILSMQRYDKQLKKWISQTFEQGDMAGIIGFVRKHGERNYAGQMKKMSATLPGMLSTLKDNISQRFEDIGDAGMDKLFTNMMKRMIDLSEKIKPVAERFGALAAEYIPKTIQGMKELLPLLKPIALGFGLIGAHMIGLQVMTSFAAGTGIFKVISMLGGALFHLRAFMALAAMTGTWAALKMLVAGAFTAMGAALTPLLIGGAVVAVLAGVAALGYSLYRYWTEGASALDGLRNRFPGLADAVQYLGDSLHSLYTELKPELTYIWDQLKSLGKTIWEYLVPAAKWLFESVFIPLIREAIITTAEFIGDWVEGYKVLKQGWEDWKVGFQIAWDTIKGPMEWLFKKLEWLASNTSLAGLIGKAVGYLNGDSASADPAGVLPAGAQTGAANPMSSGLVRNARTVRDTAGYCLRAVAKMHNMTFGADARHLATKHAADAAAIIAKSDKFTEIKVTKEMLSDPKYQSLLHGATAVYNRNSGFSKDYGHIEVFDMVNKTANFGLGGVPLARRSQHNLANARVFVPKQNVAAQMPNIGTSSSTGNGAVTVPQTMNFYGPANPQQVRNASQNGTQAALNKAGLSSPKPSNAR